MTRTEVAIVGAGPYGLSLSAALAAAGIDHRVFGQPMQFWSHTMPPGMALKTSWATAGLYNPQKRYSLVDYCAERGLPHDESIAPIDLETFVAYGLEFQRRFVSNLCRSHIERIAVNGDGYRVATDDGAIFDARCVVIATGVTQHHVTPDELVSLPAEYCTHSSISAPFDRFKGKDVVVVGGGASAVDAAAALVKVGARPIVVARRKYIRFQSRGSARSIWQKIKAPESKLGPGWRALAVTEMPRLFHLMPANFRVEVVKRFLGPAANWPAREIVERKVPFRLSTNIVAAKLVDSKVSIDVRTNAGARDTIVADHVIAATGYRPDVRNYALLDPAIRERLALAGCSPKLSKDFESSQRGLYFTGAASANSFGPMFRFVVGSEYTSRIITSHLASTLTRPKFLSPSKLSPQQRA